MMSGVMRSSVRSLKPWRMASCPAACGMRWVNPSKATVSPLLRLRRTASARGRNSDMAASQTAVPALKHRSAGGGNDNAGPTYNPGPMRRPSDAAPDGLGRAHHQLELALLVVLGERIALLGRREAALRGDAELVDIGIF